MIKKERNCLQESGPGSWDPWQDGGLGLGSRNVRGFQGPGWEHGVWMWEDEVSPLDGFGREEGMP